MQKIATALIELLCHITAEPDGGHDPDITADLQLDTWQLLIHEISESEQYLMREAATKKLSALLQVSSPTPEQEQLIDILDAFSHNNLQ